MEGTKMEPYPPPNAPIIGFNPPNPNYPPPEMQGGYPPSQGGYPPSQGYPPPQGGYPPPQGYAPPQGGYPPPQGGYPPPQGGYPPAQGGYPPTQGGYPPPQDNYLPSQGGYPPESMYPAGQGGYPAPTVDQPTGGSGYPPPGSADQTNWMPRPVGPACPLGLEYLTLIDQLVVHQKVEMLEAFIGFETKNKYSIKNSMGQKVYTAKEDTDCLTRMCLGPSRPFDIKIKDMAGNEVMHLYRPFRCDSCCFPCCLQKMEVMAPPGTVIGTVTQHWSLLCPKFTVENAAGEVVLRIEGPFCTMAICGDVDFQVLSKDGSVEVGKITKQWSGLLREAFTDSDHFGITFPMDLDVNIKAVLLGACFLIDYMFFEKSNNKENDSPGML